MNEILNPCPSTRYIRYQAHDGDCIEIKTLCEEVWPGFGKELNALEVLTVFGEQLKEDGLEWDYAPDGKSVRVFKARKSFLDRKAQPSKRAKEYMAWCDADENIFSIFEEYFWGQQ